MKKIIVSIACFVICVPGLLQADQIVQVSSGEVIGLTGVVGSDPALNYLGVVANTAPLTIDTDPETPIQSLHSITPNVGDVIGRDLVSGFNFLFANPWSYRIELPADADLATGLFDIALDGEVHFNNTDFELTDFLFVQMFVNDQATASATSLIAGIDGGGVEVLDLSPVSNLPGTITSVEVRVQSGLFAQADESFLFHNINLSANYVQLTPIPEPAVAVAGMIVVLGLIARRRRTV